MTKASTKFSRANRAANTRARRREGLKEVLAKPEFENGLDMHFFILGLSALQKRAALFMFIYSQASMGASPAELFDALNGITKEKPES